MALMECSGCGQLVNPREMQLCLSCGAPLCPACAESDEGLCPGCVGNEGNEGTRFS